MTWRFALHFAFACNMSKIEGNDEWFFIPNSSFFISNVENNGFEPLTPCLQSRCSSQLS